MVEGKIIKSAALNGTNLILTFSDNTTLTYQGVTQQQLTTVLEDYVQKDSSGGSETPPVTVGTPTADSHATNVAYINQRLSAYLTAVQSDAKYALKTDVPANCANCNYPNCTNCNYQPADCNCNCCDI